MIAVQKIFGLLSDTPGLSDIKLAQNDRQTIGKNIEQAL
jgi:putative ribosome biogenesis GTPase RsgA